MNTVKSFWYGWGALVVAGGGAYYFAKQSIDSDRREKHMQRIAKERYNEELERQRGAGGENSAGEGSTGSAEKGKYVANEPYRSRRGDRFS